MLINTHPSLSTYPMPPGPIYPVQKLPSPSPTYFPRLPAQTPRYPPDPALPLSGSVRLRHAPAPELFGQFVEFHLTFSKTRSFFLLISASFCQPFPSLIPCALPSPSIDLRKDLHHPLPHLFGTVFAKRHSFKFPFHRLCSRPTQSHHSRSAPRKHLLSLTLDIHA